MCEDDRKQRILFKHLGQIPVYLEARQDGFALRCQGIVIGVGGNPWTAAADAVERLRALADAIEQWNLGAIDRLQIEGLYDQEPS
jgi:hypothetical protein